MILARTTTTIDVLPDSSTSSRRAPTLRFRDVISEPIHPHWPTMSNADRGFLLWIGTKGRSHRYRQGNEVCCSFASSHAHIPPWPFYVYARRVRKGSHTSYFRPTLITKKISLYKCLHLNDGKTRLCNDDPWEALEGSEDGPSRAAAADHSHIRYFQCGLGGKTILSSQPGLRRSRRRLYFTVGPRH